ncbi:MAG: TonB-dependent receptor [Bacteroidota bacterium]
MKKQIKSLAIVLLLPFASFAQYKISGKITDAQSQEPLLGAVVQVQQSYKNTISGSDGSFSLTQIKSGKIVLITNFIGYLNDTTPLEITADKEITIQLKRNVIYTDEVIISSTRANEKSGATFNIISKQDIEKQNLGVDMPYLLNYTPSVVVNSDAGAGVGYTGIRVRGSDGTRINTTINGIPVNDAESHGTFWVNLPDLASSVNSIQLQRGVGTSSNGAGAFGGSLNIETNPLKKEANAEVNTSYGSFNTFKRNIKVGSGLIDNKWTVDGRLSQITSDGYIDRASSNLKSYYISTARYGEKNIFKLTHFSGSEKTFQAWAGVPQDTLKTNRTYNPYTYNDETDNYKQDYYQAHFSQEINANWSFNTALFLTKGKGFYEQFRQDDDLANYNINAITANNDTILTSDLIRRRWLDNNYYGGIYSINYNSLNKLQVTLGGGFNQYDGKHFGEVIWARYAGDSFIRQRYYENKALKNDLNTYLKVQYDITNKLYAFVDVQSRNVQYSFLGFDNQLNNVTQNVTMNFINPKLGLTFDVNNNNQVYASFSVANREPNRDDFTQSTPTSRPKPENLKNLEAGWKFKRDKFYMVSNYYLMLYTNELVLTGAINDVGAYVRTNIDKSYRSGFELQAGYKPTAKIELKGNVTLSQNKVITYNEYLDDYDNGGQVVNTYKNTNLAFSPNIISGTELNFNLFKNFYAAYLIKYVGKQYMDNTSNENRTLNAYMLNDIRLNYSVKTKWIRQIDFTFMANNILNKLYEANGYTYSYIYGGQTVTENFYYPQAGFNWLGGVSFKF